MYLCPLKNIQLLLIFVPVGILALLYGCVVGWTSNGIAHLGKPDSEIELPPSEEKLIAVFFELGRSAMAIPIGMLSDQIGRRPIIYLCNFQHLLVWSLICTTKSKYIMFLARFISGLAVGTGNAVLFIYAGEISPRKIRGTVISLLYTCYYLGILVEYILGACLSYLYINLATLSLCLVSFCFMFFIKESPIFLLTKGKDERAKKIYMSLNQDRSREEVTKEFDTLKEYAQNQNQRQSLRVAFADPINRRCVTLVFVINFLTMLTGLPVLVAFIHTLYTESSTLSKYQFSILFATIQYVACCCASVLSDKIGRRKMYSLTCTSSAICHAVTAVLYFIDREMDYDIPGMSWMLLLMISIYACIYAAGLGPMTVIVRGELLPQAIKGIGSGLAVVSAGISCFLLIFLFNFINDHFGVQYNFVFFCFTCISLLVLTHYKLPETKHKTLAEIQEIFRNW